MAACYLCPHFSRFRCPSQVEKGVDDEWGACESVISSHNSFRTIILSLVFSGTFFFQNARERVFLAGIANSFASSALQDTSAWFIVWLLTTRFTEGDGGGLVVSLRNRTVISSMSKRRKISILHFGIDRFASRKATPVFFCWLAPMVW